MKLFEATIGNERLSGGSLAHSQLKSISEYSQKTSDLFQPQDDLPDWVQVKLATIEKDMHDLYHELDAQTFAQLSSTDLEPVASFDDMKGGEPAGLLFDDTEGEPEKPEEIALLDEPKPKKKEETEDEDEVE
jgi:hypothetical protein